MNPIRLPLGMRDYNLEQTKMKRDLQKKIETLFESYGYREVSAPSIEYLDTYKNAFSSLNANELYKFIDTNSDILALRMDMTVPIARLCVSKFKDVKPPFRIRYCSDVYKVRQSFAGKRSQVTDCGIELIGLDQRSDLEVLGLALDTLQAIDKDRATLEIGNSQFFKVACDQLNLDDSQREKMAYLIDHKQMVDLQEYVLERNLSKEAASFFMELPLLNDLDRALELSFTPELEQIVTSMKKLAQSLDELGYKGRYSFDLGKVPHLDYYTGILFEGFVPGVGVSVLSGGRYDGLLESFGWPLEAVGFSVKLDYLMDKLEYTQEKVLVIQYPYSKQVKALEMARDLRKTNKVELVPYDQEEIQVKEELR